MDFGECRNRFDEYVADTVRVGVYLQGAGEVVPASAAVDDVVEVRVVVSNHPGGQPDTVEQENPPSGVNLHDVRLHISMSEPPNAVLVVPEKEGAYYRSGWEVTDEILTPGADVRELYVHFDSTHPTFDLPTTDVLDDHIITARATSAGSFTVSATARVTPRWRTISSEALSALGTVVVKPHD